VLRRKDDPNAGGGTAALIARARSRLRRLEPWEAAAALEEWAVLVDIRTAAERAVEGEIPDALVVERNVLEWRFDPAGPDRLPMAHRDLLVIVVCSQGQTSSLAAAALQDVGVDRATDVVGGFKAWRAAGLATSGGAEPDSAGIRVEGAERGDLEGDATLGTAAASFASGIVVVSALDNSGGPVGVAVRTFMALSSDPTLVAVALPCTSRTLPLLLLSGVFGVSVLGADQATVARRFASGLPLTDRFDGVDWVPGRTGVPLVTGSLSVLECSLERENAVGEQVVVVGRVTDAALGPHTGPPLLYHRGALVGPAAHAGATESPVSKPDEVHANGLVDEQSVTRLHRL
jgi:flavin reductase (DIM6/NTAB) family NADH-FMN oxidoreductase RutF/rhodanese-related sulfurtransferase